jgi:flagellar assembly protein FliH
MSNDVVFAPVPIPVLAETEQSRGAAQAARARGYAAGYAEGLRIATAEQAEWLQAAEDERSMLAEAAAQRAAGALTVLRAAAVELAESTLPLVEEVEGTLVSAAFELAEAVVGHALQDRLAAARAAVSRVLEDELANQVGVVRLNPADLQALEAVDALGGDAATVPAAFVADPAVAAGDAIGELPDGWLDARIRTALDRARGALA